MKTLQLIVLLFFCFGVNLFSQDEVFYIQIKDNQILPIISRDLKTDELKINGKTNELNDIYSKYKIYKFEQAFPTAATPWLRTIYLVKCNDKNLGQELKSKFKEKVPLVETLCDPMLTYTPNDYGLEMDQKNLDLIKAKEAWDISKNIPNISIAITDTYFDLNHEDLNFVGIQGSNNPNVSSAFHGTFVAGCIAATTDNNIGISSIGYKTPIYVSTNWANDNEVLLLAQAGYRVINCSWYNSCEYSTVQNALYEEIRNVWNAVVVAGAGNAISHCGSLSAKVYPASYNSVISVTSIAHQYEYGYIDPYYGPVQWKDVHESLVGNPTSSHHHNDAVDICAPGYSVNTTARMGTGPNGANYNAGWGTSFASPQVAGTVGLIIAINPCLTANEAADMVINSSDPSIYSIPENSSYINLLGHGRLDAYSAVAAAAATATLNFQYQTLGTQNYISNYAIKFLGNVNIASISTVNFSTRKEISIVGPFEVPLGSSIELNVNSNNAPYCQ